MLTVSSCYLFSLITSIFGVFEITAAVVVGGGVGDDDDDYY